MTKTSNSLAADKRFNVIRQSWYNTDDVDTKKKKKKLYRYAEFSHITERFSTAISVMGVVHIVKTMQP